ncbi:hypothetical protein EV645_4432 [Kribbella rubisoli]|uniref:Uncharacterized protein n=1 Tax=Kribbella rubisoli TaxID=3075929 RepID=A0A4V2FXH3_9ACTN|nr:hypothetical protein [Kribbella rubisoli]RZU13586.1 hypothetical protein EV645_4432 [Kribbella rubisoli]
MKVTTFRELMREQANAAVRISGAHHSSWNGRYGAPIAETSKTGGTANWNHTISYNPRHVDEPLQDMFRNNRVHNQDKAELRRYRDALRVVLHENAHLLSSEGREHSQAEAAFSREPGVRPLEEGVTELYSHQALNEYIDELGIDQVAPGIKEVRTQKVYPEYTPAVEGFAERIEQKSGVQRDELIGRLAVVPADQKFKVAAAAMYDNSRLRGMIPEDQREHAIGQVAKAMSAEFARVDKLPQSADADARRAVGMQAVVEGSKVISRLKKQWQMPAPGQQVQRGVGAEQGRTGQPERGGTPQSQSATGASLASSAATAAPASPAASAAAASSPAPPSPPAPALPPDIAAAARAGLSGPPLGSASRLSADRQGARGAGASAPAAQRQGPETQR